MSKKIMTLTIGIPAYNEAASITELIRDVLRQQFSCVELKQVIVSSDASTDGTDKLVRGIKDPAIVLLSHKKRAGKAAMMHHIFREAKTDIVVILDADVRLPIATTLDKLCAPIAHAKADLTSCRIEETQVENALEKTLRISMQIKQEVTEKLHHGDNVYTCHGTTRAFSRRLYSTLVFPIDIGEDGYSYLYCKQAGMKYCFVPTAKVTYHLPSTFTDHKNQSIRFLQSKQLLSTHFGEEAVQNAYALPPLLTLQVLIKYAFSNPIQILSYISIYATMVLKHHMNREMKQMWDPVLTSKHA